MKNNRNIKPRNTRNNFPMKKEKKSSSGWLVLGGLVYWAFVCYLVFL